MTVDTGVEATTAAEETTRLFGLDMQLIHDTLIMAINVFLIFFILSYLVFNPARKMLSGRREKVEADILAAEKDKKDADALKKEYEARIEKADEEAEDILSKARSKALKNEADIIAEAKEEAARLMERADTEIERERRKALEGMKQEIIDIAGAMATKAVGEKMDVEIQEQLLDETLKEMGEDTWQN
ncbi:MAG: F0F1 ATP synthase subunit B [Lachnospiraceae bacterium]|nr:F0F1 ATP synthase subunit B [Lachnospiraceae bacterium]